jgi:cell division protein FtsL
MAREIRRVNSRSYTRQMRHTVEDGNAVREPEWNPERKHSRKQTPNKKSTPKKQDVQKKQNSRRKKSPAVQKKVRNRATQRRLDANRARETRFGVGYVAFLCVACIISVLLCINYLHLRSRITTQTVKIASMESNLSSLKQDNDAYYKEVIASVTIDDVRDAALNRLGMHYPSEDEIRYYSTQDGSYVRQYQDVS